MEKKEPNLRIREILKENGITQRDLAEMMGVSAAYVTNLVHGRSLSVNALGKIAACLNVEIGELFDQPKEKPELEALTKRTLERMLRFPDNADMRIAAELMYNLYKTMPEYEWQSYLRSTILKLLPKDMKFAHLSKFISDEEFAAFLESLQTL